MAISEQTTALVSLFPNRRQAERFTAALKRAGFREQEVGLASPEPVGNGTTVEEGALAGSVSGLAPGALAGAVAAGLVPGIGPVITIGMLAGILGGAAAGATTGGLIGALVGLGVSEDEAQRSHDALRTGQTVVTVCSKGRLLEAASILRRLEKDDHPEEPGNAGPELEVEQLPPFEL